MLLECQTCQAKYQIDDEIVNKSRPAPNQQLFVRCRSCSDKILISNKEKLVVISCPTCSSEYAVERSQFSQPTINMRCYVCKTVFAASIHGSQNMKLDSEKLDSESLDGAETELLEDKVFDNTTAMGSNDDFSFSTKTSQFSEIEDSLMNVDEDDSFFDKESQRSEEHKDHASVSSANSDYELDQSEIDLTEDFTAGQAKLLSSLDSERATAKSATSDSDLNHFSDSTAFGDEDLYDDPAKDEDLAFAVDYKQPLKVSNQYTNSMPVTHEIEDGFYAATKVEGVDSKIIAGLGSIPAEQKYKIFKQPKSMGSRGKVAKPAIVQSGHSSINELLANPLSSAKPLSGSKPLSSSKAMVSQASSNFWIYFAIFATVSILAFVGLVFPFL